MKTLQHLTPFVQKPRLYRNQPGGPEKIWLIRPALLTLAVIALCFLTTLSLATAAHADQNVSAPTTCTNSDGSATITYGASFTGGSPAYNEQEDTAENVTYAWSGDCTPTNQSSTTVTKTVGGPGQYGSGVGCTATWTLINLTTGASDGTVSTSGSATTTCDFGDYWQPGKIVNVNLQSPQNQSSSTYSPIAVITSPGGTESCSINPNVSAYDLETWNGSTSHVPDAVGYSWSCESGSFGGSPPSTTSTASSATWTAAAPASPPQGSSAGISCQVTATPATMGPYDTGSTGPSPAGAGVTVYMPVVTVAGQTPAPGYIDFPITGTADMTLTPSVPNVTPVCSWSTTALYYSKSGLAQHFTSIDPSCVTWTGTSATGNFSATFGTVGWYIFVATCSVALQDSSGSTLWSGSAPGYVGGTADDVGTPGSGDGTPADDAAAED